MDTFVYPSTINYVAGAQPHSAVLTIEPLFHGYGTTIGNALRRVLLSSLPGGALTGVKIVGIPHEFTTMDGVKEDAVEIRMNLKQIALKIHTDAPVRLHLSKKGKGPITAGDFTPNSDVEIVNPETVIATLTDDTTTFALEAMAEIGYGYVPTEERESEEMEVGWIKLDALYSPVKSIAFRVEPVRIGEITNYDRVVMDIETSGVLSPEDAVRASTEILMKHFSLLAGTMPTGGVGADNE